MADENKNTENYMEAQNRQSSPSAEKYEEAAGEEAGLKKAKTRNRAKKKKKHGIFFKIIIVPVFIIGLILAAVLGFAAYSALDGIEPAEHIPHGYYAYINLPSAGRFLEETLSVKTLDSVFADTGNGSLQGLIRSLRVSPVTSSRWFTPASNFRTDAAAYSDNSFLVIAKLGFRSAVPRLLPLLLKFNPDLFLSVKELRQEEENGFKFWSYKIDKTQNIYIGSFKDALIISGSKALFFAAFKKSEAENIRTLKRFIKGAKKGSFNILSDINQLTNGLKDDKTVTGKVFKNLSFPEPAAVTVNLNEQDLSASGSLTWDSDSDGLKTVLTKKSFIPGILSRLPKSTDYITLLNMGSPDFLFKNGSDVFTAAIVKSYKSASSGTRFLFKKDIDELLFSWMGSEIGFFGMQDSDTPVSFVSLKDEKRCRETFESIFNSVFVQKDTSAVVDGLRIPRIEFPDIIKSLLRAFKIELPTPFYIIKDGYLYLSQSAEVLASAIKEAEAGALLVKTENWKNIMRSISPETSLFVYYTIDNQVPFLLKNNTLLKSVLKDYGRGIFSIKLDTEQNLIFEFYTQKTKSRSLGELAAFPYSFDSKIESLHCGKTYDNVPFAYWTSGSAVYALNLAAAQLQSLELDDKAFVNVHMERGRIKSVWAVSARGTVYKTDYLLNPDAGFPILTGEKFAVPPEPVQDGIVLPVSDKPVLLFIESGTEPYYSDEMDAKLKGAPAVSGETIAALPRAFDSAVYCFDKTGKLKDGYPAALDSISAVQPVLYKNGEGELWYAILTEDGKFLLHPVEQKSEEGFEADFNEACKVQPVYSPGLKSFFVVTDSGILYKLDTEAQIMDKITLKQKGAKAVITLLDLDKDGKDDVLISGSGNSVYAYTSNFSPFEGFPAAGTGTPYLIDADGDGKDELILRSLDNKIHALQLRKR